MYTYWQHLPSCSEFSLIFRTFWCCQAGRRVVAFWTWLTDSEGGIVVTSFVLSEGYWTAI
jgi:hypothetical protein